ncbi:MAG: DegT/DnrJ/EryC1/StrS family aminotransferase [Rhodanobacter sp.]
MLTRRQHELPPTAGLPPHWSDLRPGAATLATTVAAQLGTPPLQLECSGSACLLIALLTLRKLRPQRRRVVMPAFTCPLVAIVVHQAGLELQLCDLLPDHYDMDPAALRAVCNEQTLAIIPTHLGGRIADVDAALTVAHRVGAYVIEDAAQALGARYNGSSVGLAGDVGFFSLAAGKGLSIYEGGLLVARDPVLREQLALTSTQSVPSSPSMECRRSIELLGYTALYRPHGLRLAYGNPLRHALQRGDVVAAVGDDFALTIPLHRVGRWRQAIGAHAATRLPAFTLQLATQAQQRLSRLRQIHGINVLDDPTNAEGTWPFLLLLLPDQARRDAALAELWEAGFGVSRLFIHALPDYSYLSDIVPKQDVPNARNFANRSLSISNSLWLTGGDFETICSVLESALA